ncbi:hypothetical protein XENOCAPTIV_029854, partial [Xenoophorus captivus]
SNHCIVCIHCLFFPKQPNTTNVRAMLPRQQALSLCSAAVDHGMCNVGQIMKSFSSL